VKPPSEKTFKMPLALTLMWSTRCRVIVDPSVPVSVALRVSWKTRLLWLRLAPNQIVMCPS